MNKNMSLSQSSLVPFDIVVAVDTQKGIGKKGGLPWHIVADLQHFRRITTLAEKSGSVNMVVMGRKTWESLPRKFKPLPARVNCVVSRNPQFMLPDQVLKAASLDESLTLAGQLPDKKIDRVFVIGGAQLYQAAFAHPLCRKIYWTQIYRDFQCDAFVGVDLAGFDKISESPVQKEGDITFSFIEYQSRSCHSRS